MSPCIPAVKLAQQGLTMKQWKTWPYILHSIDRKEVHIFNYLPQQLAQNLVNCVIRSENLTALFFAKSRNLIGTLGLAKFGPK